MKRKIKALAVTLVVALVMTSVFQFGMFEPLVWGLAAIAALGV